MDIIVDGEPNFALPQMPMNLGDVVRNVSDILESRGRALQTVSVNGQPLSPETLAEELAQTSLVDTTTLEITSASIQELINESIEEMESVIEDLPIACHSLAAMLSTETAMAAMAKFAELATVWHEILDRQLQIVSILDTKPADIQLTNESLADRHKRIRSLLIRASTTSKGREPYLLSEMLEYDLAPLAEEEAIVLTTLRSSVTR